MGVVKDDHLLINDVIHYALSRNEENSYTAVEIIVRPECN
jgi:hypothetical protein